MRLSFIFLEKRVLLRNLEFSLAVLASKKSLSQRIRYVKYGDDDGDGDGDGDGDDDGGDDDDADDDDADGEKQWTELFIRPSSVVKHGRHGDSTET